MKKISREELNKIFKRAKHFRPPKDMDKIDFSKIKFLGWIDQTRNVVYSVLDFNDKLEGVKWNFKRLGHVPLKPAFCEICKRHRRRDDIIMIIAKTRKTPKGVVYIERGNYVCYNIIDCSQKAKDTSALEILYKDILN